MFKNRTLLGLVSILIALVFCFGVAPLVSKKVTENKEVYILSSPLQRGDIITEDKVSTIKIETQYIPDGAVGELQEIMGKMATEPSYTGDFLITERFSEELKQLDDVYRALGNDEYAVSVSVDGLAGSVSGTLLPGDIVSVFEEGGALLEEMRYVEVLAIADSTGKKEDDDESKKIDYVVLRLTEEQITLLTSEHYTLALKYRGSQKDKFLEAQKNVSAGNEEEQDE